MDETPAPDEHTALEGTDPTTAMEVDGAVDVDDEGLEPVPTSSGGGVSKTVLVVSILLAGLVAGIVGVIIGWKVEQQRVKDDLANIRPIGRVAEVDDDTVRVTLSSAEGSRTYTITDATVIDGEAGGDTSALPEGSTVLVKSKKTDGELEAVEIVVFPEGTTYG